MASVTVPANGSVQLDSGSNGSLYVINAGVEDCTLDPGGIRLRPGQSYSYIIQPGVAVTAKSRNGTTVSYTVTSTTQPDVGAFPTAIDCGLSS